MSADNYFDYWLRINHFTPSALVALNGTILRLLPHEIVGIVAAVLLAASIPVVFWITRTIFRYGSMASVSVAIIYGFNPINWYAVYHVAMGQLLAASAIAILTWIGIALWQIVDSPRKAYRFVPVLVFTYITILGSYTFIVVLAGVPACVYAATLAFRRRLWRNFLYWLVWMLAPFVLAASIFYCRLFGLIESSKLFRIYDFGWKIPSLLPDGWFGIVYDKQLDPLTGVAHWAALTVMVGGLGWALVVGIRCCRKSAIAALVITIPILAGYGYLSWHDGVSGGNSSYDAYKLFAVFYPCLLPAFCYWLTLLNGGKRWLQMMIVGALTALVFGGVVYADYGEHGFERAMSHPSLVVERDVIDLERIEGMQQVNSVNMLIPEMWDRIWASEFLLRKCQYFATHTYLGRLNTPLRGEWDLTAGLVSICLPDGESIKLSGRYSLTKLASHSYLRLEFGDGWYDLENGAGGSDIWRWSMGDAKFVVDNLQLHPLKISLRLKVSSLKPRDLQLWINGKQFESFNCYPERRVISVKEITVLPGATQIQFRSDVPYTEPGSGDTRRLGFAIYGIEALVR